MEILLGKGMVRRDPLAVALGPKDLHHYQTFDVFLKRKQERLVFFIQLSVGIAHDNLSSKCIPNIKRSIYSWQHLNAVGDFMA